jgi:hypothetical protein
MHTIPAMSAAYGHVLLGACFCMKFSLRPANGPTNVCENLVADKSMTCKLHEAPQPNWN